MSNKTVEDYLKALSILSSNGKTVTTNEISHHFKIAPASVTEMLKNSQKKNTSTIHPTTEALSQSKAN